MKNFDTLGYYFDPELVVYCHLTTVFRKRRRRLVLIASIWDKVELIPKTHSCSPNDGLLPFQTVKDAIGNLPKVDDGEVCEQDPLHRSRKLNNITYTPQLWMRI